MINIYINIILTKIKKICKFILDTNGQTDRQAKYIRRCLDNYHLVVDLVEVDLAHLVHDVLVLVDDEPEPPVTIGLLVEHQENVFNLGKYNVLSNFYFLWPIIIIIIKSSSSLLLLVVVVVDLKIDR